MEHVFPEGATDYEMWQWMRSHPSGFAFIPIDIKTCNLTIGRTVDDRHKHFYHWTVPCHYEKTISTSEVIFANVEGVHDSIAVLPSRAWLDATTSTQGSYGIESLSGRAPSWMPVFMVHLSDLAEAVESLSLAADDATQTYVNPTNGIAFTGWELEATSTPDVEPSGDNKSYSASFESTLEFLDEAQASGCRVHFNPIAPISHDIYLSTPLSGLLRFELKVYDSLETLHAFTKLTPRNCALAPRRTWHVLYMKVSDYTVCITRDEALTVEDITEQWLKERAIASFDEALAYIARHAQQAREKVKMVMRDIQPGDICAGLPEREIILHLTGLDPLIGHERTQLTLPWVRHMINVQCMQDAYGICFSLGEGHPLGTHLYVDHTWTEQEMRAFQVFGKLPLDLWSRESVQSFGLILRLEDHAPKTELLPAPYAWLRAQWKKPVRGMEHFLTLGWIGAHQYFLLPSEFTALSSDKDPLPEPVDERHDGGHFSHSAVNSTTELQDPPFPSKHRACVVISNKVITDKAVRLDHHFLDITDGSMNRNLKAILQSSGACSIGDPAVTNTKAFAAAAYRVRVSDVLQITWDYGCTSHILVRWCIC